MTKLLYVTGRKRARDPRATILHTHAAGSPRGKLGEREPAALLPALLRVWVCLLRAQGRRRAARESEAGRVLSFFLSFSVFVRLL